MKISHITPDLEGSLASTRYRILIPGVELTREGHEVWVDSEPVPGADVHVWHKTGGEREIADLARLGGIFDVTDGHYDDTSPAELVDWYHAMTRTATAVTASSPWLAEWIEDKTGSEAIYIPDPYEFPERPFEWHGGRSALWYGSPTNFHTLRDIELDCPLEIITACGEPGAKTNVRMTPYSRDTMLDGFARHDIVILPVSPMARKRAGNANRAINALRQGKFVVCHDTPAHRELEDFVFIADRMLDGIQWGREHPASVKAMVDAGQAWIRDRFSPAAAAAGWREAFRRVH